jgi:hypothetical protein
MLSKSKLRKNQSLQSKLCNNNMPFSLPIIEVEQKLIEQNQKLQQKSCNN